MENRSYIRGEYPSTPYPFVTIPELLDQRKRENPSKSAYVFRYAEQDEKVPLSGRRVVTFSDLADTSLRLAGALLSYGIQPNDRVAIIGSNCPEFLFVEYACLRISVLLIRLPINLVTPADILETTKKLNLKAWFVDNAGLAQKIEAACPGIFSMSREKYAVSDLKHIFLLKKPAGQYGLSTLEDLLQMEVEDVEKVKKIQEMQDPDDFATTFPTSGSSGKPKFVVHSHDTLATIWRRLFEHLLLSGQVYLCDRPFSWMGGFVHLPVVNNTSGICLHPQALGPGDSEVLLRIVKEEEVVCAFSMSYFLYDLMQAGDLEYPPCLETLCTGGERVSDEVFAFAKRTFGQTTLSYGLTEDVPAAIMRLRQEDPDDAITDLTWLKVVPGVEIKVVDDDERMVRHNEIGNVEIRSKGMFLCYLEDDESTKKAKTSSGWLRTGDLAVMRPDGRIKIVGRKTDAISRGGSKVYPILIESLLLKHPKVQRAAVVGVPDPRLFNEICAFVIPKPGATIAEDELVSFINTQVMDDRALAVPKYTFTVNEFPSGSTGKLDKKSLVEKAQVLLKTS